MTREIKFRAWNNLGDEMMSQKDLRHLSIAEFERKSNLIWMQFTGLQDKNGKYIYDGDILFIPHWNYVGKNPYAIVKFEENVKIEYADETEPTFVDCFIIESQNVGIKIPLRDVMYMFKDCYHVGNKYANPELLERRERP